MWRIANCVYRAFRQTATHCRSQYVLIPLTTIFDTDDDDSKLKEYEMDYLIDLLIEIFLFLEKVNVQMGENVIFIK
jgi:hypothetical protein